VLGRDDPLLMCDPVQAMVDDGRSFLAVDPEETLQAAFRAHIFGINRIEIWN